MHLNVTYLQAGIQGICLRGAAMCSFLSDVKRPYSSVGSQPQPKTSRSVWLGTVWLHSSTVLSVQGQIFLPCMQRPACCNRMQCQGSLGCSHDQPARTKTVGSNDGRLLSVHITTAAPHLATLEAWLQGPGPPLSTHCTCAAKNMLVFWLALPLCLCLMPMCVAGGALSAAVEQEASSGSVVAVPAPTPHMPPLLPPQVCPAP